MSEPTRPDHTRPPTGAEQANYVDALVAVAKQTTRVRELERELEQARAERRELMRHAVSAGASVYRVAKEADTSHASAWRIVKGDQAQKDAEPPAGE